MSQFPICLANKCLLYKYLQIANIAFCKWTVIAYINTIIDDFIRAHIRYIVSD